MSRSGSRKLRRRRRRKIIEKYIENYYKLIINLNKNIIYLKTLSTVFCGVKGRALASHTGVHRFDAGGVDSLLLFADYKLRSIYKSWFGIHFN